MRNQTYAEKLRDPRWKEFKEKFLRWRRDSLEKYPTWCDECGEDKEGVLHVHHTVYYSGREPWEYEYYQMRLYCEDCHGRLHAIEKDFAAFVRTMEPHECYELRDVLESLESARHHGVLKIALARAKNAIRDICHKVSLGGNRE